MIKSLTLYLTCQFCALPNKDMMSKNGQMGIQLPY